jgi:hypothetical protein
MIERKVFCWKLRLSKSLVIFTVHFLYYTINFNLHTHVTRNNVHVMRQKCGIVYKYESCRN